MKARIAALLLIAFAFGLRLSGLDSARHDIDRGYPHGLGIRIVEQAGAGEWSQLPLFSLSSAVALPNLAMSSYGWAMVSLFDRSAFAASAISAMLGVLTVAMVFDLGRRMFGDGAGVAAAALAAASVWGGFFSRGTWLQGQLEFFAVTTAWLIWTGVMRRNSRRIVAGMAVAALAMQTYAVAMGLFAQVTLSLIFGLKVGGRQLLRPFAAGFGLCLASLALYAALTLTQTQAITQILQDGLRTRMPGVQPRPAMQVLGVRFDPDGWRHALRIPSGRDFEAVFTDTRQPNAAWIHTIAEARAWFVEALMLAGIALSITLLRRHPMRWMVLAWFAVPILATLLAATTSDTLNIAVFYLLLTAPAGYLLAGAAFGWLGQRLPKAGPALAAFAAVIFCLSSVPAWGAHIAQNRAGAWGGKLIDLPLQWQMQLGRLWRSACSEVNNGENNLWLTSVLEGTTDLRHNGHALRQNAEVWQIAAQGGNCVTTPEPVTLPIPLDTLKTPVNTFELVTYRAKAIEGDVFADDTRLLTTTLGTNIGWTLIAANAPDTIRAGEAITVQHAWRIDDVPAEPHDDWYFAPFVKLFAPEGEMIQMIDYAPGVNGVLWRKGDLIISQIVMRADAEWPAGDYKLELSLFDPNQKKNAVYFHPDSPAQPIVVLDFPVRINR